jgi:hypothetical protein
VEVDVFQVAPRHVRGLLILTAVAAIALAACGSTKTAVPSGPTGGSPMTTPDTTQPSPIDQATDNASSLDGAAAALSNLTSFKFKMTVVGGDLSDNTLSSLPNAPTDNVFKVSGTYILAPNTAADITVAGCLHEISVGGSDYQDPGAQGSFTQSDTPSALVGQLSPSAIYSAFDFTAGFALVASASTDPAGTDHYQAGDTALVEFASVSGVQDASWTADVWIARDGGYPVRISIVATTSATNKTVVYERSFDLTDVNAATNKVTAPTNVTGA